MGAFTPLLILHELDRLVQEDVQQRHGRARDRKPGGTDRREKERPARDVAECALAVGQPS
jgi:hypothetical protein